MRLGLVPLEREIFKGECIDRTYFGIENATGYYSYESRAVVNQYLPLDEWVFLTGTYDSTTIKLYWNGEEVATSTFGSGLHDTEEPIRISGYPDGTEKFQGYIRS